MQFNVMTPNIITTKSNKKIAIENKQQLRHEICRNLHEFA